MKPNKKEPINYFDDTKIRTEIIALTGYLRFGYEKLIDDNKEHWAVPIWKDHWGDWLNNHINITDEKHGGLLLETKKDLNDFMKSLRKSMKILDNYRDSLKEDKYLNQ